MKFNIETWNWRKYIPFWKDGGTPMVSFMTEKKIPFREWNDLFKAHGADWYEVIKKLSVDRMMDKDFEDMPQAQKAMLGATMFLEFMQQLEIEISYLDKNSEE